MMIPQKYTQWLAFQLPVPSQKVLLPCVVGMENGMDILVFFKMKKFSSN